MLRSAGAAWQRRCRCGFVVGGTRAAARPQTRAARRAAIAVYRRVSSLALRPLSRCRVTARGCVFRGASQLDAQLNPRRVTVRPCNCKLRPNSSTYTLAKIAALHAIRVAQKQRKRITRLSYQTQDPSPLPPPNACRARPPEPPAPGALASAPARVDAAEAPFHFRRFVVGAGRVEQ